MKSILLLFSICLTLSAEARVHKVSKRDIEEIKCLFERLVVAHDFAYTVFGSKPMSLADMCLEIPPHIPIYKHLKMRFLLTKSKRSLNAWYRCKNEFVFKDFIFLDKEEDLFDCLVLVLINKNNMLKVLHNHESTFKEVLGASFTPESFLDKIEKKEITLSKAIHDNDQLLGIMLGYGERNATLFQERFDLLKEISKKKKDLLQVEELKQKLNVIETQLGDFSEFEEDPIIPPLYFFADISHPETIELKQKYENDRMKIEKLIQKRKFMDRTLQKLLE